ncbi:MAG TPA: PqiC family protein [Longimicrobiales bacterium]|nr:PqiC family protein [Longimicrobiales bacterium]
MRNTTRAARLMAMPAILMMAGCFSLGRDTPPLQQFVLGATPVANEGALSPDATGLTLGLRRLDLAAYLAMPSIVTRRGAHQVMVSEFHRWGEDPVEGINRALAGYLAATQPVRAVDVAPWPVRSGHAYLVQVHVTRFEGVAPADTLVMQGEAHVQASWEIHRPGDGIVLARGGTDYRGAGWRVGDYAGLVTLLDGGLNALARDLVACMARLGAGVVAVEGTPAAAADRPQAIACPPIGG